MSIADKLNTIAENNQKVYDRGVEAGRQAEHDEFWDNVGSKYTKMEGEYLYAFAGKLWNDETFNPPNDIVPLVNANDMFVYTGITDTKVTIDLSRVAVNTIVGLFSQAKYLRTIRKVIFRETTTQTRSTFEGNNALRDIVVEGTWGKCDFYIADSPLTIESCKSIINALKDYSGTDEEFDYTLYLKSELVDSIKADLTAPNGVSWYAYAQEKGWNI